MGIGGSRLQDFKDVNEDGLSDGEDDDDLNKDDIGGAVGNFLTKLYEDDNYKREREEYEKQIIEGTQLKMESKSLLSEMDEFMDGLKSWKDKRGGDQRGTRNVDSKENPDALSFQ